MYTRPYMNINEFIKGKDYSISIWNYEFGFVCQEYEIRF